MHWVTVCGCRTVRWTSRHVCPLASVTSRTSSATSGAAIRQIAAKAKSERSIVISLHLVDTGSHALFLYRQPLYKGVNRPTLPPLFLPSGDVALEKLRRLRKAVAGCQ